MWRNKGIRKRVLAILLCMAMLPFTEVAHATAQTQNMQVSAVDWFESQLGDTAKIFYAAMEELYQGGAFMDGTGSKDITEQLGQAALGNYAQGKSTELAKAFQLARDAFDQDHGDIFYVDFTKLTFRVGNQNGKYLALINNGSNANYYSWGYSSRAQVESNMAAAALRKQEIIEQVDAETKAAAEATTAGIVTDADIVTAVHNAIINTTTYTYPTDGNRDVNGVYGTLIKGTANCEGYSRTMKWILDEYNIPCILVSGAAQNSKDVTEEHMWNDVQIDNKWFAVDATWDDPIGSSMLRDTYLLRGSAMMITNHFEMGELSYGISSEEAFQYPVLEEVDYSTLKDEEEGIITSDTLTDLQIRTYPDVDKDNDAYTRYEISYKGMNAAELLSKSDLRIAVRISTDKEAIKWQRSAASEETVKVGLRNSEDETELQEALTEAESMQITESETEPIPTETSETFVEPTDTGTEATEIITEEAEIITEATEMITEESETVAEEPVIVPEETTEPDSSGVDIQKARSADVKSEEDLSVGKWYDMSGEDAANDYEKHISVLSIYQKSYVQFCVTTLKPDSLNRYNTDLSEPGNHTLISKLITTKTYSNYVAPPYVRKSEPTLTKTIKPEKQHYVVQYDERLIVEDANKGIGMLVESTQSVDGLVENLTVTDSEYTDIDGEIQEASTVEYDFTPTNKYQGYINIYTLTPVNLVGVKSKKVPKGMNISTTYPMKVPCPFSGVNGSLPNAFVVAFPTLVVNDSMDIFEYEGSEKANAMDIRLVATRPTEQESKEMTDALGGMLEEGQELKSSATYDLSLNCGSTLAALKRGKGYYVTVALPYPPGFDYEANKDVEFKAYHYALIDGKYVPQELTCRVTPLGLEVICESFSPFTVAVMTKSTEEKAPINKIISVASETAGGTVTTMQGDSAVGASGIYRLNAEESSKTFSIQAAEGYRIDKIVIDGNQVAIDENTTSFEQTFDFYQIKDERTLQVFFIAQAVSDQEKEAGIVPVIPQIEEKAPIEPVTSVTSEIPTSILVGNELVLTGSVLPEKATFKDIIWAVKEAGNTGAEISKNSILTTKAGGEVTIQATVMNGIAAGSDFIKEIKINVTKSAYTEKTSTPSASDASITENQVNLNPISVENEIVEYAVNTKNEEPAQSKWQDATLFTSLSAETEYYFFARVKGNGIHTAGPVSDVLKVTTKKNTFIPVTNITEVPAEMTVGAQLTLTGKVAPENATNKTIVWSIKDAGTTGAAISGNVLKVKAEGTVTITATVRNGLTENSDYTKKFSIAVTHSWSTEWSKDAAKHWHPCTTCGEKRDEASHTASEWMIDKAATTTAVGSKHQECTICKYVLKKEEIPKVKVTLTGIKVTTMPTKIKYVQESALSVSGGKLTATYSNDTKKTISMTTSMVSGYNKNKVGSQKLTVTYQKKKATFTVTVTAPKVTKITWVKKPTKVQYLKGNSLSVTGSKLKVTYENKTTKTVNLTTSMVTGYNKNKPGSQKLTVTYGGKKLSYTITMKVPAKWVKTSKGWRYQQSSGTFVTNKWFENAGKWYHFDAKGYMQTGWLQLGSKWYYLYESGAMAENTYIGIHRIGSDGVWIDKM